MDKGGHMLAWICASLCCHEQTYGLVFGGKQAGWAAQVWLPVWEVCPSGDWRACLRSDGAVVMFGGPHCFPSTVPLSQ